MKVKSVQQSVEKGVMWCGVNQRNEWTEDITLNLEAIAIVKKIIN